MEEHLEREFIHLCESGKLNKARKFLKINVITDSQNAFWWACFEGNLKLAKCLLKLNPTKWLWWKKRIIDISADNESAFRWVCKEGHLELAKWLYYVKPTIDISAANEFAFRYACVNDQLEVAKWLQTLNPEKYYLEIINDKIINFK